MFRLAYLCQVLRRGLRLDVKVLAAVELGRIRGAQNDAKSNHPQLHVCTSVGREIEGRSLWYA